MPRKRMFQSGMLGLWAATLLVLPAGHAAHRKLDPHEQANLANFDDLDFNVYNGQKWDQLGKSHAKDITVHWSDDRVTKGIDPPIGLYARKPSEKGFISLAFGASYQGEAKESRATWRIQVAH